MIETIDATKPIWWNKAVFAKQQDLKNIQREERLREEKRVNAYIGRLLAALAELEVYPTPSDVTRIMRVGDAVPVGPVLFRLSNSDTLYLCVWCCNCTKTIDTPIYGGVLSLGEALMEIKDWNYHAECVGKVAKSTEAVQA